MRRGLALLTLVAILGLAATGCASQARASDDVTITFRFSRFTPQVVTVPAGVPVSFTLRNNDPIEHEWIVGNNALHARHRLGTEPYHDEIPTEVTVPALSSRNTTVTFDQPGLYAFICHLPGHEAYGMFGSVQVVER